jgi:putative endopeptidase
MRISRFAIIAILSCLVLGNVRADAQSAQSATGSDSTPKLEHFDPNMVDKSLDPCQDFYQYACSKWNAANPIPSDQVVWGTGSGLEYWNENILREAMQKAASQNGNRTDYEQKVGDYWAACMDESGIEAAGTRDLKTDLDRIDQMTNKSQLADQVAYLHKAIPGAWQGDDNQTRTALPGLRPTTRL